VLLQYDAFISYARDDGAIVKSLVERLRSSGYHVFVDLESIRVGENWKRRLEAAILKSRVLILCWSASSKRSEYVTFEYMRALALKKPVYPWRLDATALPAMIDLQAITAETPEQAAEAIAGELGWTTNRRRLLAGLVATAVMTTGSGLFITRKLARRDSQLTWEFHGVVGDNRHVPLADVKITIGNATARSDAQGRYTLRLAGQRPERVELLFQKEGYQSESIVASTERNFEFDLMPSMSGK
jgi:hypothetical protein